jgi:hypothetical protein
MSKLFIPTRLYIKECNGLKYFGKCTGDDIERYNGSGKRWSNHYKKYGKPKTLWVSDWYYEPTRLTRFALLFSHLNKIVESPEWANLRPENGLDGGAIVGESKQSMIEKNKVSMKHSRANETEEQIEQRIVKWRCSSTRCNDCGVILRTNKYEHSCVKPCEKCGGEKSGNGKLCRPCYLEEHDKGVNSKKMEKKSKAKHCVVCDELMRSHSTKPYHTECKKQYYENKEN